MNKFRPFFNAETLETFLDEIFNRLDIVIGHFFDFLHLGGILFCHIPVDAPQRVKMVLVKICKLRKGNLAQGYEILYLNPDSVANQCVFAEILSKGFSLTGVSSVNRGYCEKWEIIHKSICWFGPQIYYFFVFLKNLINRENFKERYRQEKNK